MRRASLRAPLALVLLGLVLIGISHAFLYDPTEIGASIGGGAVLTVGYLLGAAGLVATVVAVWSRSRASRPPGPDRR